MNFIERRIEYDILIRQVHEFINEYLKPKLENIQGTFSKTRAIDEIQVTFTDPNLKEPIPYNKLLNIHTLGYLVLDACRFNNLNLDVLHLIHLKKLIGNYFLDPVLEKYDQYQKEYPNSISDDEFLYLTEKAEFIYGSRKRSKLNVELYFLEILPIIPEILIGNIYEPKKIDIFNQILVLDKENDVIPDFFFYTEENIILVKSQIKKVSDKLTQRFITAPMYTKRI